MVDEITMDETHIGEDDEEGMDMEFDLDHEDDGELGGDLPADGMDDMGGEEDLETKVMDLEAELDSLKAEFEKISGEMGGDDEESFGDEEGDEESFGDEEGGEEEGDEESPEEMYESSEEDEEEDDDEEEMTESRQRPQYQKTAVDLMREYVEKISAPSNTEFTPVGTGTGGDKPAGNTKNPLAGKNDMGGTTANIVKGGTEQAPDGNSPKGKAGGFLKNAQEIDVAKRNVNKPGGNKGAQDWYNTKASAKKGEGQTTDGSVPVQKKSIEPGGN
jgi:hypothetical protein